jgi:hypothetical protein
MRNFPAFLVLPVAAFLSAQKPTPPRPIPAQPIQTAPVAQKPAPSGPRLPGTNAFHTVFDRDAAGRHDGNAYLLMYLSSAIYPEMLDRLTRRNLGAATTRRRC